MNAPTKVADEQLLAELRERGLVSPVSADFLASYRQGQEFADSVERLKAMEDGLGKFRRALVRVGIMSPAEGSDGDLLDAWARFTGAVRDLQATGVDAPREIDAPIEAAMGAADDDVLLHPATTMDGAIAKLRRAILMSSTKRWVEDALVASDDTTLFARAEELDASTRLLIDVLAGITIAWEKPF